MTSLSTALPSILYTGEQARALDRTAIEAFGIPGFRLMQRAGQAAFNALQAHWPQTRSISVLCCSGNNGGDGFIIAGLAAQAGWQVQLVVMGDENFFTGLRNEASEAWLWCRGLGVKPEHWQSDIALRGTVLVDAMLGIGLKGEVRGTVAEAIHKVNRSRKPVLAVDIPSGLCADTGAVLGSTVRADLTITFIGVKQGLLTHQAPDYVGELVFDDLKVPEEVYDSLPVGVFHTRSEDVAELLRPRKRTAHKGDFGHLLVVGGDHGMGGAAIMAAQAAGRTGAGLISLATRPEHVTAALIRHPEVMAHGINHGQELQPLLKKASAVVIGPGLGQAAWGQQVLQQVLATELPVLLDADALNLLAENDWFERGNPDKRVITPHPGEAAHLLATRVAEVQADRFGTAQQLQQVCGGAVVLKGSGSLVCDGDAIHLCSAGNPGMASGGMGDVLSGIIGALLAQGLRPVDAARLGVFLHAQAADQCAALQGERGMQATDLLAALRPIMNKIEGQA